MDFFEFRLSYLWKLAAFLSENPLNTLGNCASRSVDPISKGAGVKKKTPAPLLLLLHLRIILQRLPFWPAL